jgi:diadenosine tetraphosphatase ApaH/serine/threonine PP2A family protein phosphatase
MSRYQKFSHAIGCSSDNIICPSWTSIPLGFDVREKSLKVSCPVWHDLNHISKGHDGHLKGVHPRLKNQMLLHYDMRDSKADWRWESTGISSPSHEYRRCHRPKCWREKILDFMCHGLEKFSWLTLWNPIYGGRLSTLCPSKLTWSTDERYSADIEIS